MNAFDRAIIAAALEAFATMHDRKGNEKMAERAFQLAAMFRRGRKT